MWTTATREQRRTSARLPGTDQSQLSFQHSDQSQFSIQYSDQSQLSIQYSDQSHCSKLITFIDLAGHQKYLRTTISALTGYCPHYVMLVVSATAGVVGMTQGKNFFLKLNSYLKVIFI